MKIISLQEVRDYYKHDSNILDFLRNFPLERIGDATLRTMALTTRQSLELLVEELNRLQNMVDEAPPPEKTVA